MADQDKTPAPDAAELDRELDAAFARAFDDLAERLDLTPSERGWFRDAVTRKAG